MDRTFADKFIQQAAKVGDLSTVRSIVESVERQREHLKTHKSHKNLKALMATHLPEDVEGEHATAAARKHLIDSVSGGVSGAVSVQSANVYIESFSLDNQDNFGQTASHVAASQGQLDVLKYLLEKGANPKVLNSQGLTVAHVLAHKTRVYPDRLLPEVWRLLLEKGAVNCTSNCHENTTCLHVAVRSGAVESARILIEICPELLSRHDSNGFTPRDMLGVAYAQMEPLLRKAPVGVSSEAANFRAMEASEKATKLVEDAIRTCTTSAADSASWGLTEKLAFVRENAIGRDAVILTPNFWHIFHPEHQGITMRLMLYADYTASGRALRFIEEYLDNFLRYYANTHTEISTTGKISNFYYSSAIEMIRRHCGAGEDSLVLPIGGGVTGALQHLMQMLGLYYPPFLMERLKSIGVNTEEILQKARAKYVVIVGYSEHHSNDCAWFQNSICLVDRIPLKLDFTLDYAILEQMLKKYHAEGRTIFCSLTACSNVTGVLTDVQRVSKLVHRFGGLVFFDHASSGPYVDIHMMRDDVDAVMLSPHKNLGGPGGCGVLVCRRHIVSHNTPSFAGGGTVSLISPWQMNFLDSMQDNQTAGTPLIKSFIQSALSFGLKDWIGEENIHAIEHMWCSRLVKLFRDHPRLKLMGPDDPKVRLPTFSFLVKHNDRVLHQHFVSGLMNDLFAIQTRSGCACAGPQGHILLGLDEEISKNIWTALSWGFSAFRPGWCRLNVHYTMTEEEVQYMEQVLRFIGWFSHLFLPEYLLNLRTGMVIHYLAHDEPLQCSIEDAVTQSLKGHCDYRERFLELKQSFQEVDDKEAAKKKPKPMAFSVMRNAHEAFRGVIKTIRSQLEMGQVAEAKAGWLEFVRASDVHMAMEDKGMFQLIDAVSGGDVTKANLGGEHKHDTDMLEDVTKAFEKNENIIKLFDAWWDFFDQHMRHEELLMLQWTTKCGSTPMERAVVFHHQVLAPADKKPAELDFYIGFLVRSLQKYGTRQQPPDIAVRVFVWGLWASSSPSQWARFLPIVKANCLPAVFNMMVEKFEIDKPGPVDPKGKCPKVDRFEPPQDEKKKKGFFARRTQRKESAPSAAAAAAAASKPSMTSSGPVPKDVQERAVLAEVDRSWFWRRQINEALYLVCAKVIRLICKDWKRFAKEENRLEPGSVPEDCVVVSEEMHQEMEDVIFKVLETFIITNPSYDELKFGQSLTTALRDLLARNGLKRHVKFSAEHLPRLIMRYTFGTGSDMKSSFESFSDTSVKAASWFYWPKGNFFPSKEELLMIASKDKVIQASAALNRCTSSFEPVFEDDESMVGRKKFTGFKPCTPCLNILQGEKEKERQDIFRSFAEGGS